jgi:hypothetical protein
VGSDEIVARLPRRGSEAHPLRIGNAAPAGGGRLDFRITATLAKVGAPAPGPHPGDNVVTAAWFTVEKLSGSVEAGAFEDIPIRFTAAGLQPGTYDAALTVTSNAASEANATVRLRLEVANPTDTQETLPAEFALAAVENPVRGTARFRIAAPHSGPVDVRIYDVRGREVRRLLSGDLGAGQH